MKKQLLKITMILCLAGMVFWMGGGTAKAAVVYETEDNGSYDTADLVTPGTTVSGNISSYEDKDYYKVVPSANGKISLFFTHTFKASSSSWDIHTYVYKNGEYKELSSQSVSLKDNEKVSIPSIGVRKDGNYYIVIERGYSDIDGIPYSLETSLEATEVYEKEQNDVYATATDITLNGSMSGNLVSNGDKDYYKMTTAKDGKISLNFSHVNQNNSDSWSVTTYRYYDGAYTEQSRTYISLNDNEKITLPALGAVKDGVYYIVVEKNFGDALVGVDYKIDASFEEISYEKEDNDVYGTATAIKQNQKISGNISKSDDLDYYKITAESSDSYTISFMHSYEDNAGGWNITVFSEKDGEYKELSSTFVSLKDSASFNLPAVGMAQNGIYYIKVEKNYGDTVVGKEYSLLLSKGTSKNTDNKTKNQTSVELEKGYLYSYCSAGKGSLKLYWSTVSDASGYQIRYARNKSMTRSVKTKKISGQSSEQKVIKKLSRRKVYYVQIRAYKSVDGKVVYGKWSSKKKLKTK